MVFRRGVAVFNAGKKEVALREEFKCAITCREASGFVECPYCSVHGARIRRLGRPSGPAELSIDLSHQSNPPKFTSIVKREEENFHVVNGTLYDGA